MPIQHIIEDCGLAISKYEQVHGGDINHAYCLYGQGTKYFLKINDAKRYPAMFEKEVAGLHALRQNTILEVPAVVRTGVINTTQYLLLEWLEKGYPEKDCSQNFGAGLAQLHQKNQPFFGWPGDNFIGSLLQLNSQQSDWHIFYGEYRIMPLVKTLFNTGAFSRQDLHISELFCKQIAKLFPAEPPALLHGDLWSGNYLITHNGYAAIFDPAVYYGHREMDIGMSKLFGGFDQQFYDAYNEVNPLEIGWQQRLPLTQLYPLLVHAVLFGGHYVAGAKEIINNFSR